MDRRSGWTLIEVMLLIAIIGVLLTVGIHTWLEESTETAIVEESLAEMDEDQCKAEDAGRDPESACLQQHEPPTD